MWQPKQVLKSRIPFVEAPPRPCQGSSLGTALFAAGGAATGAFHWLESPLKSAGLAFIVLGAAWVPVAWGLSRMREPLARVVASQIDTTGIVNDLAVKIGPALVDAAHAFPRLKSTRTASRPRSRRS